MANNTRVQRVADLLQQVLSQALRQEVNDPRLSMASISAVEVSRDLAHAKVFISTLGEESSAGEALKALEKAKGFLRRIVAKECELRIVPQLHFFHDTSVLNSQKMTSLINQALASDEVNKKEK